MTPELFATYVLACFVVVIVPGPIVTIIIANGLAHGARAGLLNVAGAQAGMALMLTVLAVGLAAIVATMGVWFDWLRLAGALYLVWLGIRLLRSRGAAADAPRPPRSRGGFFLQGLVVVLSNPKALLFFGAFIPQFVDPNGPYLAHTVLLGLIFMAIAALSDGAYAVLAGRAGRFLTRTRVALVEKVGGLFLIGGGIWLAALRR